MVGVYVLYGCCERVVCVWVVSASSSHRNPWKEVPACTASQLSPPTPFNTAAYPLPPPPQSPPRQSLSCLLTAVYVHIRCEFRATMATLTTMGVQGARDGGGERQERGEGRSVEPIHLCLPTGMVIHWHTDTI